MTDYINRIKISLYGNDDLNLYTKSELKLSNGYNRIVIGDRGPYVEISDEQLIKENELTMRTI